MAVAAAARPQPAHSSRSPDSSFLPTFLQGVGSFQNFLGDILGGNWSDLVPSAWSKPSEWLCLRLPLSQRPRRQPLCLLTKKPAVTQPRALPAPPPAGFSWDNLGSFDYSSNLQTFLDTHDLRNMTRPTSIGELHDTLDNVTAVFCKPENFTASRKKPTACAGPTVTLAYVPKECILDEHTHTVSGRLGWGGRRLSLNGPASHTAAQRSRAPLLQIH